MGSSSTQPPATAPPISLWGGLRSLCARLPRLEDPAQRNALGNLWRFLALMLVFTLVARGTAGAAMARVQLARPYRSEIVEAVRVTGRVEAVKACAPTVSPGIAIEEISVVPGQQVSVGDLLAALDPKAVEERRKQEALALEDLELELALLSRAPPHDGTVLDAAASALESAEAACDADAEALEWAEQDVEFIHERGLAGIQQAENLVAEAERQAADARRRHREAREFSGDSDWEGEDVLVDTGLESESTALADALAVLRDAELALGEAVAAAENADEAARRTVETAKRSLDASRRAKAAAKKDLEAARASDGAARQTAADSRARNAIDAQGLQLKIGKQKELLERLDEIGEGGEVYSQIDGTVLAVCQAETTAAEEPIVSVSDERHGFQVVAPLTKAQAKELKTGARASVHRKSGYEDSPEAGTARLVALHTPDSPDDHTATFQLPQGKWTPGEEVSLQVVQRSETWPLCVPLSAVCQDQEGYFVLTLRQSSDVLGVENIVRRTPVSLAAEDGELVALEGMVSQEDRVVVQSSKPLTDGDRVRVKES